MPGRIRQFLASCLVLVLVGCGQDRVANGTTGTEAGNALTAILLLPDGRPAARAQVTLRPSDAVDSSTSPTWIHSQADDQGLVQTHFGAGSWTLEARLPGFAWRSELRGSGDTSLSGTLNPVLPLRATVLGAKPGTVVALPGLARSTRLDSTSSFIFDSLPPQPTLVTVGGVSGWTLEPGTDPIVLSMSSPDVAYRGGTGLLGSAASIVSPWLVADSLLSTSTSVFTDSIGKEIPAYLGHKSGTDRVVWLRMPGPGKVFLRQRIAGPGPSNEVFSGADGFRLVWLADSGAALLGGFRASGSAAFNAPSDSGAYLRSSLGGTLGGVDSGLPDTGSFAFGARARLLSPSIGSLWVLDWTDSTSGWGVRVGVGGGWLTLRGGSFDTTVAWDPGRAWFQLGLSWDGQTLRLAADGVEKIVFNPANSALTTRSAWTRHIVGLGGSLDLAHLLVLDRAVSDTDLSRPPQPLR